MRVTRTSAESDDRSVAAERTIHIERDGRYLDLGERRSVLRELDAVRLQVEGDARHGYRVIEQTESLHLTKEGARRVSLGLAPAYAFLARRHGFEPALLHQSPRIPVLPCPRIDWHSHAPLPCDLDLPTFICAHTEGLIPVGRSADVWWLIAQCALCFPDADLLVLGAHQHQLRKVAKRVQSLVRSLPGRQNSGEEAEPRRITFSTFFGTGAASVETYRLALVFMLDARHVTRQQAQDVLLMPDSRFRLFGFLRTNRQPSKWEQASMMAAFGPHVLDIPAHGLVRAAVSVARLRIDAPRIEGGGDDLVALKRAGYWRHPVRNRQLARLARALADGDGAQLRRHPTIHGWFTCHDVSSPKTVVLAENLEHALHLADHLPGWLLIASDDANVAGLSRRHRQLLASRRALWNDGRRQIVTLAAAGRLTLAGVDAVIWAGGGPHRPLLPDHWLHRPAGDSRGTLLVDVDDRHHPRLAVWSRQRRQECVAADGFDLGIAPVVGRVNRFLVERPGGTRQ